MSFVVVSKPNILDKNNEQINENVTYVPVNKSELVNVLKDNGTNKSESYYLYFSVCVASLLSFSGGVGTTWTSAVIPKLKLPSDNPLNAPVTTVQISLIASLYDISQTLGPHIFVYICQKYSKKTALFWINLIFIIGNVILGFADSVECYYFARFIMGTGFGGSAAVTPIYISEITADHNRGKFNCLHIVFINLGFLYSFSLGPFLTVKCFNFLCILPPILFLMCFKFLPESSFQLLKRGNSKSVKYIIQKLGNNKINNTNIEDNVNNTEELCINDHPGDVDLSTLKIIQSKLFKKTFLVGLGFMVGVPLSGILTMLAFSQQIFMESGTFIPAEYSSIIIGCWITFVTFVITYYIIEKFGRKTLMAFGSFGATICLFFITTFFFLKRYLPQSTEFIFWVPITFTILYLACFQCYGVLIWTVLTEIFSPDAKALGVSTLSSLFLLAMFLTAFFFPIIYDVWGMAEAFLIHSIFSLLTFIIIFIYVPETKNKPYEEIKKYILKLGTL